MVTRYYSSVAAETNLSAGINNAATVIMVGSVVGLPSLTPYTLALDYESASEELVEVTNAAGTNLTVTRAIDGTSATSHNAGARVRHVSSARDFSDSRTHENSTSGVHGTTGDLVGTTGVQTLSDKILDDATGTLNRIDILSEGGSPWVTSVNGDIDHAVDLMKWQRGPVEPHFVARIYNTGGFEVRNQDVAADAVTNAYRLRVVKDNGTTDIFSVLSGGTVTAFTDSAINGFTVKPRAVTAAKAFNVRNVADSADTFTVTNAGALTATSITTPLAGITDLNTTNITSSGTINANVVNVGTTLSANTITNGSTFNSNTAEDSPSVTVAAGWSLTSVTRRTRGGWTWVNILMSRTGADIAIPANGNVAPDLAIITSMSSSLVPTEAIYVHAGTGVGSGSVRVNTDTSVDLTDWVPSTTIATSANLRFWYAFID